MRRLVRNRYDPFRTAGSHAPLLTLDAVQIKADRGEIDHPPLTQYAVKPRTWEAMNATASEESVRSQSSILLEVMLLYSPATVIQIKADRGEIEHPQLTQYAVHPRMWEAINATISEESVQSQSSSIITGSHACLLTNDCCIDQSRSRGNQLPTANACGSGRAGRATEDASEGETRLEIV